jgi:hypothetical protein
MKCFKIMYNITYVTSYSYGGGQLLFKFCGKKILTTEDSIIFVRTFMIVVYLNTRQ